MERPPVSNSYTLNRGQFLEEMAIIAFEYYYKEEVRT